MINSTNHTFVIPAYKESDYIRNCIESLLNQTVKSTIIIASSTPSEFLNEIAETYKLPLMINAHKQGIASDWSFACNCSTTKYVTLAHQDDIYLPDYTSACLSEANKTQGNLITFTDYREMFNDRLRGNTALLTIKRLILLPFFLCQSSLSSSLFKKAMLSTGSPICCPSVMFNRENLGIIEFNNELSINMDWDFWLKLASRIGSFTFIKKKLMIHRIHEDSETSFGLINNKRQSEDCLMFNKIWPKPIAGMLVKFYSLSYLSNN